MAALPSDLRALVRMDLLGPDEPAEAVPLTGGVSSDIWRIDLPNGPICVKRALAKLRVAADWQAPVERNRYEAAWMHRANAAVPGTAPPCSVRTKPAARWRWNFSRPPEHSYGRRNCATATPILISPRGSRPRSCASMPPPRPTPLPPHSSPPTRSSSTSAWSPICLQPRAHIPISRRRWKRWSTTTQTNKRALVHGDVSPKNILAGPRGPVFLDAECAWWGDPAFDLAFCLNHLLLKCVWTPRRHFRLPCAASMRFGTPICRRHLGTAGRPGSPRRPAAARIVARPGGWQVAGRVHHRASGQGPGAPRRSALLRDPPDRLADVRRAPGAGKSGMTRQRIAFVHGRRVWDSRGRPPWRPT